MSDQEIKISIHAARVGCDNIKGGDSLKIMHFNPRSPSGLRRRLARRNKCLIDFNPRSPSGLRLIADSQRIYCEVISIHAARVGCDQFLIFPIAAAQAFQSTQPEWAATPRAE